LRLGDAVAGWTEYRPGERGLRTVLNELESEIMNLMWRKKRATARTVYTLLNSRHSVPRSKVNATMNALCKKGLLSSKISRGRGGLRYIYKVRVSRSRFEREVVEAVVTSLLSSFRNSKRVIQEILSSGRGERGVK
jgi:predicted transcriptional regulator